jgi:hypothetical protein
MIPALAESATRYRQAKQWEKAEVMWRFSLDQTKQSNAGSAKFGEVLSTSFELYRWALSDSSQKTQGFGHHGIKSLADRSAEIYKSTTFDDWHTVTAYENIAVSMSGKAGIRNTKGHSVYHAEDGAKLEKKDKQEISPLAHAALKSKIMGLDLLLVKGEES